MGQPDSDNATDTPAATPARQRLLVAAGAVVMAIVLIAAVAAVLLTGGLGPSGPATNPTPPPTAASDASPASAVAAGARLELAADPINLGSIPQDEEAEYLLAISNTGDEPLTIEGVLAS